MDGWAKPSHDECDECEGWVLLVERWCYRLIYPLLPLRPAITVYRMHIRASIGRLAARSNKGAKHHERPTADRHARLGSRHPRAVSAGEPLAGVARRRGRAGPRAGRTRHHPARTPPRRSHGPRGWSCWIAPASTKASPAPATPSCRWSGNCRAWSASRMAAGCIGAPRRRTSRRPAICWCCGRRTASSCA